MTIDNYIRSTPFAPSQSNPANMAKVSKAAKMANM